MYTIEDLYTRYPVLESCRNDIDSALQALIACYDRGGKLLCCGNGGSAADCDHIVGEMMKKSRKTFAADCRELCPPSH